MPVPLSGGAIPPFPVGRQWSARELARYNEIIKIISSGKVARFTATGGLCKDVSSYDVDEDGDMMAFRTRSAFTNAVCWESNQYTLSAVDHDTPFPD